jgi:hypothetical protein
MRYLKESMEKEMRSGIRNLSTNFAGASMSRQFIVVMNSAAVVLIFRIWRGFVGEWIVF